jgi:hypothetical protein
VIVSESLQPLVEAALATIPSRRRHKPRQTAWVKVRVEVIDGKRAARGMKWSDATAALINYQSHASQPHIDVAQCFCV